MAVALLVAAGRGERLGADGPKAFVVVAGRSLLDWSLSALRATPEIERIVVALPAGAELGSRSWATSRPTVGNDVALGAQMTAVTGGATRSQSVRAALAVAGDAGVVVVHDAARPLAEPALFSRCIAELAGGEADAAVAAAAVSDTVKEADTGRTVRRTLDRSTLWAVQTPQAFRRAALERALDQPDAVLDAATDDAGLVEGQGGVVRVVPAPAGNLKVTTPVDLQLADLLLRGRGA